MIRFDAFIEDMGLESKEDIAALYLDFVDEVGELLQLLDTLEAPTGLEPLLKIIHNLKGVCANLYVDDFSAAAKGFEDQLKAIQQTAANLSTMDLTRSILDLRLHYHQAKKEISAYFGIILP